MQLEHSKTAAYHIAHALTLLRISDDVSFEKVLTAHARFLEQTRAGARRLIGGAAFAIWYAVKTSVGFGLFVLGTLSLSSFLQNVSDTYVRLQHAGFTLPFGGQKLDLSSIIPTNHMFASLQKLPVISWTQCLIAAGLVAAVVLFWKIGNFILFLYRERLIKEQEAELDEVISVLLKAAQADTSEKAQEILKKSLGSV